jgi:bleomycin hydrolase
MRKLISLIASLIFVSLPSLAQDNPVPPSQPVKPEEGYKFSPVVDLKATSVKDQSATETCWCFATTSFVESELLRMGKGDYDLSEMYIIRHNYIDRLKDNYLRRGKGNTGPGGLSHDWFRVFSEYGMVPDEVYTGLNYGSPTHNHTELQDFINAVAAVPVELNKESPQYFLIVNAILDTYLGKVPESFTYKNATYTPKSFAASLGINPDDYVEITSFTHFPFYTQGVLEVPDNWTMSRFYNVPLDELIQIMDYSFNNGFTVNWDGDVSESGFSRQNGYAIMPLKKAPERGPVPVRQRPDRESGQNPFGTQLASSGPGPEMNITQEIRQAGYENFTTTDDHQMHLTGIANDQNGTKYYKTKNSWGTERSTYNGYWYMSEQYVRAKTIFIMVNKKGIPPAIKTKLGL